MTYFGFGFQYATVHAILGLIAVGLALIQITAGFARPGAQGQTPADLDLAPQAPRRRSIHSRRYRKNTHLFSKKNILNCVHFLGLIMFVIESVYDL